MEGTNGTKSRNASHITISGKFCKYIDHNDITCFAGTCDIVLKKNRSKQSCRFSDFQIFSEHCPQDKKSAHCYICQFPLKSNLLRNFDTPSSEMTRLDFAVRKAYQFLKNLFSEDKIATSKHLSSLRNYYYAMRYMLRVYIYLQRKSVLIIPF